MSERAIKIVRKRLMAGGFDGLYAPLCADRWLGCTALMDEW